MRRFKESDWTVKFDFSIANIRCERVHSCDSQVVNPDEQLIDEFWEGSIAFDESWQIGDKEKMKSNTGGLQLKIGAIDCRE